jgi:hypothetical protein
MPEAPDLLAAELAAIQQRHEELRSRYGHVGGLLVLAKAQNDVPRLLAAVEAVLAKVAEWTPPQHPLVSETAERSSYLFAAKYARRDCAAELAAAITSKLLSEEESDGD